MNPSYRLASYRLVELSTVYLLLADTTCVVMLLADTTCVVMLLADTTCVILGLALKLQVTHLKIQKNKIELGESYFYRQYGHASL